jgi:ABC-type uncharacterized transport system substrate-binding protein
MRRRQFLTLLGGAAFAWPRVVRAQEPDRMRRVGVLMALVADDPEAQPRVKAFEQGLRELGWTDDSQLHIEYRWAGADPARIRSFAAELIDMAPDVIVANTTPVVRAVRQATSTIPVVFVQVTDPVSLGIVKSLAQPGGNITGFTNFEYEMGGKWVDMLKSAAPSTKSVAVIFNPNTAPYGEAFFRQIKTSAAALAIEAFDGHVQNLAELEKAVAMIAEKPNGSLIVLPDTFTAVNRKTIIALADSHHLPGIYPFRYFATAGGLLSYGVDVPDSFRRSANYVDRILRGENPADLPVQGPIKYDLVINLKTAKAFGLRIPMTLISIANDVIE